MSELLALPVRLVAGVVKAVAVPVAGIAAALVYGGFKIVIFPAFAVASAILRTTISTAVALFGPPLVQLAKVTVFTAREAFALFYSIFIGPFIALASAIWRTLKIVIKAAWEIGGRIYRVVTDLINAVEKHIVDPLVTLLVNFRDNTLYPILNKVRNTANSSASWARNNIVNPTTRAIKSVGDFFVSTFIVPAFNGAQAAAVFTKDTGIAAGNFTLDYAVRPTARAIDTVFVRPAIKAATFTGRNLRDTLVYLAKLVRRYIIGPAIHLGRAIKRNLIVPTVVAIQNGIKSGAAWISLHVLNPLTRLFTAISRQITQFVEYMVTHYSRELRYLWFLICGTFFFWILVFWPFPITIVTLFTLSITAVILDWTFGGGRGSSDHRDLVNSTNVDATLEMLAVRDRAIAQRLAATREARLQHAIFGVPYQWLEEPDDNVAGIDYEGRMTLRRFLELFHSRLRTALASAVQLGLLTTEQVETIDPAVVLAAPGLTLLQLVEDQGGSDTSLEAVLPPREFEAMYSKFLVEVLGPARKMIASPFGLDAVKLYVCNGDSGIEALELPEETRREVLKLGQSVVGLALAITVKREFQNGFQEDVEDVVSRREEEEPKEE